MAKKARRKKQSVLTQAQLEGTNQQGKVTTERVTIEAQPQASKGQAKVDFGQEYRYVISDLYRIGILAAIMLGILVGLNLLLR